MAAGGERGSSGVGMRYNYLLLYKNSIKDLQKITYHFEAGRVHKQQAISNSVLVCACDTSHLRIRSRSLFLLHLSF